MSKQDILTILALLKRVQITGEEAPRLVQLVMKLEAEVRRLDEQEKNNKKE